MSRIPSHSHETAPEVTRTELQHAAKQTPIGELLNLHAQMAHAPAVASYTGIRKALEELGTFDAKTRTAVMLTVATSPARPPPPSVTSARRPGRPRSRPAGATGSSPKRSHIGLILYVDYFVHYADTELDLPPAPAAR